MQPSLITDAMCSVIHMNSISKNELYRMIESGRWLALPKGALRIWQAWVEKT